MAPRRARKGLKFDESLFPSPKGESGQEAQGTPCRGRPGWRRFDAGLGKLAAQWHHQSGWVIQHCGHPTALWPYLPISPAGEWMLTPSGRAWGKLADAMDAVENKVREAKAKTAQATIPLREPIGPGGE